MIPQSWHLSAKVLEIRPHCTKFHHACDQIGPDLTVVPSSIPLVDIVISQQWRSSTTSNSPTTTSTRTGSVVCVCTSTSQAASLAAALLVWPKPLPLRPVRSTS